MIRASPGSFAPTHYIRHARSRSEGAGAGFSYNYVDATIPDALCTING